MAQQVYKLIMIFNKKFFYTIEAVLDISIYSSQSPIRAKEIIRNWTNEKKNFWQVVPKEIINQLKHPVFDKKNIDLKKELA